MTLDEARLLANVNHRAQRLFEDGYRIRSLTQGTLLIRSPDGATYELSRRSQSCTCPFFAGHEGRHPCKHLLGWRKLLLSQRVQVQRLSTAWEAAAGEASDAMPCPDDCLPLHVHRNRETREARA